MAHDASVAPPCIRIVFEKTNKRIIMAAANYEYLRTRRIRMERAAKARVVKIKN